MLALAFRSLIYFLPDNTAERLAAHPIKAFLFWLYINAAGHFILAGGDSALFYSYGLAILFAYAGIVLFVASALERQLNVTRYALASLFFLQHGFATLYTLLIQIFLDHTNSRPEDIERYAFILAFAGHLRIYLYLSQQRGFLLRSFTIVSVLLSAMLIYQLQILRYAMWYPAVTDEEDEEEVQFHFNAEEVLAMQSHLLAKQLAKVETSSANASQTKLYYLGFAAWGAQQVFLREEQLARAKIGERFHAEKTSLTLVNQPSTVYEQPLANRTNLRKALLGLSKKMDLEKDVLWLFITSHGAHNKGAAVSFYPFPFDANLTPDVLKAQLDEAHIKWRIIVVSACYSGYYLPALQNENTIIMTAASAETTSFGCDDSEEFTYFGRALFKDSFDNTAPLETIFQQAIQSVSAREISEKITQPSKPQLFMGDKIKLKLEEFH